MNSNAVPISVLMCVHNGSDYVEEAISSIEKQSHTEFEFVIIDDASSDHTPDILANSAKQDSRIRVFRSEENHGLTKALNKGLAQCMGKYIARIDADDRSLSDRLHQQLLFLEKNQGHVAVACGHHIIDGKGNWVSSTQEAMDDWQIRWLSGFNPPAPHPTYFFHRIAPDGSPFMYDTRFKTAQDFDLWSRMADCGKTAVLSAPLVEYRRHAGAITVRKRKEQAANCQLTGARNLGKRLPKEILKSLQPLLDVFAYKRQADSETIRAAIIGMDMMLKHDLPKAPSNKHRKWVKRISSGLIADALLSRGGALHHPKWAMAFMLCANRYIPGILSAVAKDPGTALKSLAAINKQHG